jgi:16S rRNA (cytidine1402-2'-O)-methyltransferase
MNKLIVLGLPIGNIEDVTLRMVKALFSSDIILAEDTRNYLKIKSILKERFAKILIEIGANPDARPELISYRDQIHDKVTPKILQMIQEGKSVALISDAGMPAISDPGFRLIEDMIRKGIEVDVIPGPTAVETALVISGLPTDRFVFLGFLPRDRSKIRKLIGRFIHLDVTLIAYESPFRLIKTLRLIQEIYPNCYVAACNDLTKKFQKVIRGTPQETLEQLSSQKIQGEWVVVLRAEDNIDEAS